MKNAIDQINELHALGLAINAATTTRTTAFNILLAARLDVTGKELSNITIGELTMIMRDAAIECTAGASA